MKKKTVGKKPLHILYLEDSPQDVEIIKELLEEADFDLILDCAEKKKEFISKLRDSSYDIILSDFSLPGFDAFGALQIAQETCPHIPFICVSGSIGEETAIELIRKGAVDYVLKDRMVRLPVAIVRALDEAHEKKSRQKAESALHESEERYRLLFESSMDAILMTAPTGEIFSANPAACRMFGRTEEEICAGGRDRIVDTTDPRFGAALKERERTGKFSGEIYLLRSDGSKFSAEITNALFSDKEGNQRTSLIIRDITKRKLVEERLALFSHTVKSANECISITDSDNTILYVNDAFLKMYGYSEDELLGQSIYIIRAHAVEGTDSVLRRTLSGGWQGELLNRKKDGTIFPVSLSTSTIYDEQQQPIALVGVAVDITERKQAEEALKSSEAFLNSIIDQSPLPIWISDQEGTLIRINRACLDALHIQEDEVLWKYNIFHDNIVQEQGLVPLVRSVFAEGKIIHFEIKYDTTRLNHLALENKAFVIFETTIFPLRNSTGAVTNAVIQHVDVTAQKTAEESLFKAEKKFETAFMTTPDSMNINRLSDGLIISTNKSFTRIMGYTEEELIGKTSQELNLWVHISDRERLIKELKEKGIVENLIAQFRAKNGEIKWGLMSASIIEIEGVPHILNITRDITERVRVDEALKQSEAQLSAFMNFVPSLILIKDHELRPIFANEKYGALFPIREWMGKKPEEVFPPDVAERMVRKDREALEKGYTNYDEEWTDKQGVHHLFYTQKFRISIPDSPPLLGIIISDITERKQAEMALEEQSTYFRQLFENSPVATMMIDIHFIIMDVNQTFIKMFQFAKEELVGGEIRKYIIPQSRLEESEAYIRQLNETGSLEMIETIRKRKDNQNINVFISAKAIIVRGGVIGYYIMYVDISDQKQLREQLMHSQKMESLGTLAGGIAHDFNNILAIILGHSGFLEKNKADQDKFNKNIEAIVKSTYRGISLVKQLLTFARKSEAHLESVLVNDMILEIIKLLEETFPKIITISTSLQKNIPALVADASQLHQVILNLCVNARDAMPRGGVLAITTALVEGARLMKKYPHAAAVQYVQITVRDTGFGMDKETIQKIFEPFFTTKGIGKGTGLGLALVYGVVNNHNGFIDVQSTVNEGTVFYIYFPVPERIAETQKKETQSFEDIPGGTETVLLIEDEELLRDLVKTSLESKGYSVLTAVDGADGIEKFVASREHISVVISDLGLPVLGGEDVLKKVVQIAPDMNIILASGFIDPETKLRLTEFGAKHFIQKPYSPEEVLLKIREVLGKE